MDERAADEALADRAHRLASGIAARADLHVHGGVAQIEDVMGRVHAFLRA
ncbi:hypothetical protein [Nonomuraea turkmeniaca]|nr:hypothetical protein [Nonomuraea turkmeniaca]